MRRMIFAAVLAGSAHVAQAADMPDFSNTPLRGAFGDGLSSSVRKWEGYYAGAQVTQTTGNIDFTRSAKSLTDYMLRNSVLQEPVSQWVLLEKNNTTATGFGGFVGRNYQWEDVVLGFEANYNHFSGLSGSSSGTQSLNIVNPPGSQPPTGHTYTYATTVSGNAALAVKDALTLRTRAGWATGDFLPYAFGGLALGRLDVSRSASFSATRFDDYDVSSTVTLPGGGTAVVVTHQRDASILTPASKAESKQNAFVVGYTAGLGMEWAIFRNLFLRAEWEYIKFAPVKDTAVTLNTARLGIGYKF